jgi:hypothetical protein
MVEPQSSKLITRVRFPSPALARSRAEYLARHRLSERRVDMLLAGGLIPWLRARAIEPAEAPDT